MVFAGFFVAPAIATDLSHCPLVAPFGVSRHLPKDYCISPFGRWVNMLTSFSTKFTSWVTGNQPSSSGSLFGFTIP